MSDIWHTNREVIALLKRRKGKYQPPSTVWMNSFNIPKDAVLGRGQDVYQEHVHPDYKGSWIVDVRFPSRYIPPDYGGSIGSMVKEQLRWKINFGEWEDPDEY